LLIVVGAAAIHAAVAGAVYVIQVAVAVFPHAGLVAATAAVAGHDRRLRHGAAVAVRRVIGADGFLRVLKQREEYDVITIAETWVYEDIYRDNAKIARFIWRKETRQKQRAEWYHDLPAPLSLSFPSE